MAYDSDHPWLIQPFDTEETYALFREYLFLPAPRKIASMTKRSRVNHWTIADYARSGFWEDRAAAYDLHCSDQMAKIDLDLRAGLESFARTVRLAADSLATDAVARTLSAKDAIRIFDSATKYHRLIGGLATERIEGVETSGGPDLSKWSVEDLRALKALQDKAR